MSNNNAVSMDGSGNQFSRILTLNMAPPGLAAILLAYKLQRYASQVVFDVRELLRALKAWIRANPKQFIAICVGFTLTVLGFGPPAILSAIGFWPAGPVSGSIATAWQSSIGSVPAGGLFAILQSAAMRETVMGLFYVIGALGVAVLFAVGASMGFDRQEAIDNAKIVREKFEKAAEVMKDGVCQVGRASAEKFEKAAEVMKDGICQVGMASAVKAVRVGMTVEGWWRKTKGE